MADRPVNFYAGPSVIAPGVLDRAAKGVLGLDDVGLSVMEISHRTPAFERLLFEARDRLRALLGVPESHEILFLQGGARGQMAQVPLNFVGADQRVGVIETGTWSTAALREADTLWSGYTVASSLEDGYRSLPDLAEAVVRPDTVYVHTTSNNTIYGTQWASLPDFSAHGVRNVCDMSSDILSRPVDVGRFGLIYAGAQKNAGPSGVTIVIIEREWMMAGREDIPSIWQYRVQAAKDSMYNTPPTFAIYCLGLVLRWLEERGGVQGIQRANEDKARLIYEVIDSYPGFYEGVVRDPADRSRMNVTWRCPSDALDRRFVAEANEAGLLGLKGHRLAGGLRASIYNQQPLSAVERLVGFMHDFRARN